METIEIITASGRYYDSVAKELNIKVNSYLAKTEEEGARCLISVNVTHTSAVHSSYNIEHFFCATIVTAPIGINTQVHF